MYDNYILQKLSIFKMTYRLSGYDCRVATSSISYLTDTGIIKSSLKMIGEL